MHKHKHCNHQIVKYCTHCNVVYCETCGKEWSDYRYNNLPWKYDTVYRYNNLPWKDDTVRFTDNKLYIGNALSDYNKKDSCTHGVMNG
jgi:hypothetical protein